MYLLSGVLCLFSPLVNHTLHIRGRGLIKGVSGSWGSLTEVFQWVLGCTCRNIKLVHFIIYCVISMTVRKSAFYNQYLPVGIGFD